MPRRLLALLMLVVAPACGALRTASDEPTCATETECVKLYREARTHYDACMSERARAGYAGPGSPQPPICDAMRADSERWAAAVNRFRIRKEREPAEERGEGYEVPALPAGQGK